MDEEVQLDRDLVETVPIILAETGLPLQPQKLIEVSICSKCEVMIVIHRYLDG